jgi:hypothetical protein
MKYCLLISETTLNEQKVLCFPTPDNTGFIFGVYIGADEHINLVHIINESNKPNGQIISFKFNFIIKMINNNNGSL